MCVQLRLINPDQIVFFETLTQGMVGLKIWSRSIMNYHGSQVFTSVIRVVVNDFPKNLRHGTLSFLFHITFAVRKYSQANSQKDFTSNLLLNLELGGYLMRTLW